MSSTTRTGLHEGRGPASQIEPSCRALQRERNQRRDRRAQSRVRRTDDGHEQEPQTEDKNECGCQRIRHRRAPVGAQHRPTDRDRLASGARRVAQRGCYERGSDIDDKDQDHERDDGDERIGPRKSNYKEREKDERHSDQSQSEEGIREPTRRSPDRRAGKLLARESVPVPVALGPRPADEEKAPQEPEIRDEPGRWQRRGERPDNDRQDREQRLSRPDGQCCAQIGREVVGSGDIYSGHIFAITPLITSARRLPARFATSSTASWVTCSIWPGMPVAISVTVLIARMSIPMWRATRTSGTVLIPTASAPKPRSMRSSAGVSKFGPATATYTPSLSFGSTECASVRSSSVYAPTMSGKRGPSVSSFGPRSGFVPMKLMWSLMTMRSPFSNDGFSPPHAFVRMIVSMPQALNTRTGKATSWMS